MYSQDSWFLIICCNWYLLNILGINCKGTFLQYCKTNRTWHWQRNTLYLCIWCDKRTKETEWYSNILFRQNLPNGTYHWRSKKSRFHRIHVLIHPKHDLSSKQGWGQQETLFLQTQCHNPHNSDIPGWGTLGIHCWDLPRRRLVEWYQQCKPSTDLGALSW